MSLPAPNPSAWRDVRSLIEVVLPAQQLSIEAQAERKANAAQTLTSLGSYWKGRKPLVLVRGCVLGALLPDTGNTEADLEVFELLMGMDDDAFQHRVRNVSKKDVVKWGGDLLEELLDAEGGWAVRGAERKRLLGQVLKRMPYVERLHRRSLRPEEMPDSAFADVWGRVNQHLGTSAQSHAELVEQLGVARFGRRPRLADTFCGGGSIPFEAARLGCDVHASDLNPIAAMLTWGAFNVIGASDDVRNELLASRQAMAEAVDAEVTALGIEHDGEGNRAKAFLYCLEATCPHTGWAVPLAPSWVISHHKRCVARLVPDSATKRFDIEVVCGVDDKSLAAAKSGTVQEGDMVCVVDGIEYRTSIRTLRGDRRVGDEITNDLRLWDRTDTVPRSDDVFRERLYCIHWTAVSGKSFFRAPTDEDRARESQIERLVRENLASWQADGLVPDMAIEPGNKTDELIRTRGWTQWHQCFTPRELLTLKIWKKQATTGAGYLQLALLLNLSGKLCRWLTAPTGKSGGPRELPSDVFYNQALNTFYNYAHRSSAFQARTLSSKKWKGAPLPGVTAEVRTALAADLELDIDIGITDPPYADAVRYEEITEYFIAWLRKEPPAAFRPWIWDSRRAVAIQGKGEAFRREMVRAYTAMADKMSNGGLQVVMFTHQDAGVWADMAGIFWGAGLQVTAAWYIATETSSDLKKGGHVQGTVILVLRKRRGEEAVYRDELVLEIRDEVAEQINTLVGLNQQVRGQGRSENLFEDADLQMAGYAAALRVLTAYTRIDGRDMTAEALRPRSAGEDHLVDDLIEFAVSVANEHLVPEGLDDRSWEHLNGSERFYLRMLDVEAAGLKKLDNYQNFAKAFRVEEWKRLMAKVRANSARLKSAVELGRGEFDGTDFGTSLVRAVLYGLYELQTDEEPDDVLSHLRDQVPNYYRRRDSVVAVASYLSLKLDRLRPEEASAARVLAGLVRNERLGA